MKFIGLLFSPIVFSIGFLTPLFAQIILAMNGETGTSMAYGLGFTLAISFGLMAQFRGSWIWVKDDE